MKRFSRESVTDGQTELILNWYFYYDFFHVYFGGVYYFTQSRTQALQDRNLGVKEE